EGVADRCARLPGDQSHRARAVSRHRGVARADAGCDRLAPLRGRVAAGVPFLAGARQAAGPVALSRHQRAHLAREPGRPDSFLPSPAADQRRHTNFRRSKAVTDAVIVSTARTPLAKSWKGAFNMTHGATLGGHAVKAAIERAGIDPGVVEDVLMGCA